jgi:xanthosine utilization system XapX-like protein
MSIITKWISINYYSKSIGSIIMGSLVLIAGIVLAIYTKNLSPLILSLVGLIAIIIGYVNWKRAKAISRGDTKRIFY